MLPQHNSFGILILISSCFSMAPKNANVEYELQEKLLQNYNPDIRPVKNSDRHVSITVSLTLIQVIKVRLVDQKLLSNVWIFFTWIDEFLRWNTTTYPINSTHIRSKRIWMPDIIIQNMVEKKELFNFLYAEVMSTGNVLIATPVSVETSCVMSVRLFPFDEQWCNFSIGNWAYTSKQVHLSVDGKGDLSRYVPNSEWDLLSLIGYLRQETDLCCPGQTFMEADFVFHLKRQPAYYLWNLVAPCLALLCISVTGHFLPPASGERVSLSITSLLAFTVFLLLVPETLPPERSGIPRIALFFGASVLLMSFNTVASVFVQNLYHRAETGFPPPERLQMLIFKQLGTFTLFLDRNLLQQLQTLQMSAVSNEKQIWALEWVILSNMCNWLSLIIMAVGSLINVLIFFMSAIK